MSFLNVSKISAYQDRIFHLKNIILSYVTDDSSRNSFTITQDIEFDIVESIIDENYDRAILLLENNDFIKAGSNSQNRTSRAFVFGKLLDLENDNANFGQLSLSDFVSVGYSTHYFNIDSILPEGISRENIIRKEHVAAELGSFVIANYQFDEMSLSKVLSSIHPHVVAPTLHEVFKILLEWQWAYYELNNREDVAICANSALLSMGLDVRESENNFVIKDLMNLPDMYVARFLKGETNIHLPDIDPPVPTSFKFWAAKKDIIKFYKKEHATLYLDLINLKKHLNKLQELV